MNNTLVTITDGQATTTSLKIAEVFGKVHKNVLQTIRELEVPEDFDRLNFQPVEYSDAKGQKRPMYRITRDGFTLLAMGFTGPKAMQFKLAYIDAFNKMEAELWEQKNKSQHTIEEVLEAILPLIKSFGYSADDLRNAVDVMPDLRKSTAQMLASLNKRIAAGEKIEPHILKYAWNMANCSRTSLALPAEDDFSRTVRQVFSVFDPGCRMSKNDVYTEYVSRCGDAPMSPRMFWPRAKKVIPFIEVRTADGRFIKIM